MVEVEGDHGETGGEGDEGDCHSIVQTYPGISKINIGLYILYVIKVEYRAFTFVR